MSYFLAYFREHGSSNGFYELIRAGNLKQAQSRAEKEHPTGFVVEVTAALTT